MRYKNKLFPYIIFIGFIFMMAVSGCSQVENQSIVRH